MSIQRSYKIIFFHGIKSHKFRIKAQTPIEHCSGFRREDEAKNVYIDG